MLNTHASLQKSGTNVFIEQIEERILKRSFLLKQCYSQLCTTRIFLNSLHLGCLVVFRGQWMMYVKNHLLPSSAWFSHGHNLKDIIVDKAFFYLGGITVGSS